MLSTVCETGVDHKSGPTRQARAMNGCVYPSIRRKEQPADSRTKPRPEEKNGARNRKETNKSRRTGAPLKAKRQLPPHSAAMHEGKGRPKKEPGHSIFSLLFRLLSVCFSLGFLVSLRLVFAQVVDPNFVKEEILPALLATRFQCFFFLHVLRRMLKIE